MSTQHKSFICNTYRKCVCKSFISNTYEKRGGSGTGLNLWESNGKACGTQTQWNQTLPKTRGM